MEGCFCTKKYLIKIISRFWISSKDRWKESYKEEAGPSRLYTGWITHPNSKTETWTPYWLAMGGSYLLQASEMSPRKEYGMRTIGTFEKVEEMELNHSLWFSSTAVSWRSQVLNNVFDWYLWNHGCNISKGVWKDVPNTLF